MKFGKILNRQYPAAFRAFGTLAIKNLKDVSLNTLFVTNHFEFDAIVIIKVEPSAGFVISV